MMKRLPVAAVIASVVALAAPAAQAQQPINVLTGGTSGIYYPLGVALGKIYDDEDSEREDAGAGHQGVG